MAAKSDLAKRIEVENISYKLEAKLIHELAGIRDELSDLTELLSVIAKNLIDIKYLLKKV